MTETESIAYSKSFALPILTIVIVINSNDKIPFWHGLHFESSGPHLTWTEKSIQIYSNIFEPRILSL